MNQRNPKWYKLIKAFRATNTSYRISTGLTIPFLFGAYQVLEKPFISIDYMIKSILDSEIDKYPIIQRCPVIGQHVVMVEEKAICNKKFIDFPKIQSDVSNNILFISNNTSLGRTLDRVCHNLILEYNSPISRLEFSWSNINHCWRKFDDKEIELINSVR